MHTKKRLQTCASAGSLGDSRLIGIHHVHDDAALEHLGMADLQSVNVFRSLSEDLAWFVHNSHEENTRRLVSYTQLREAQTQHETQSTLTHVRALSLAPQPHTARLFASKGLAIVEIPKSKNAPKITEAYLDGEGSLLVASKGSVRDGGLGVLSECVHVFCFRSKVGGSALGL
jgi:hypothetical protein